MAMVHSVYTLPLFPLAMHGKELRRANICRGIYGYSVDLGFQVDDQMHSRQRAVSASRPKVVQNSAKLKCILPCSLVGQVKTTMRGASLLRGSHLGQRVVSFGVHHLVGHPRRPYIIPANRANHNRPENNHLRHPQPGQSLTQTLELDRRQPTQPTTPRRTDTGVHRKPLERAETKPAN